MRFMECMDCVYGLFVWIVCRASPRMASGGYKSKNRPVTRAPGAKKTPFDAYPTSGKRSGYGVRLRMVTGPPYYGLSLDNLTTDGHWTTSLHLGVEEGIDADSRTQGYRGHSKLRTHTVVGPYGRLMPRSIRPS